MVLIKLFLTFILPSDHILITLPIKLSIIIKRKV